MAAWRQPGIAINYIRRVVLARVLAGTCPWCGRPIINGRVIDDPLSDLDALLEPFTDTKIEIFESKVLGPSLKQVVEGEGPLDWQRAARYIAEVARQLGEIHGAKQVHRNVRPGSVYLDQDGRSSRYL
jgi:hypothetical protein